MPRAPAPSKSLSRARRLRSRQVMRSKGSPPASLTSLAAARDESFILASSLSGIPKAVTFPLSDFTGASIPSRSMPLGGLISMTMGNWPPSKASLSLLMDAISPLISGVDHGAGGDAPPVGMQRQDGLDLPQPPFPFQFGINLTPGAGLLRINFTFPLDVAATGTVEQPLGTHGLRANTPGHSQVTLVAGPAALGIIPHGLVHPDERGVEGRKDWFHLGQCREKLHPGAASRRNNRVIIGDGVAQGLD